MFGILIAENILQIPAPNMEPKETKKFPHGVSPAVGSVVMVTPSVGLPRNSIALR
jgi:hypothetical protein